jgi:hypothetical protein
LDEKSYWIAIAIALGLVLGALIIIYGIRKGRRTAPANEVIDGILKTDWTRTGNIDFRTTSVESTLPQQLILRVEEKKIVENSMGEDVMQLRWRLATLDEAKEVAVCWRNRKISEV